MSTVEASTAAVARLRARFETEVLNHPNTYHPIDIERVRTENWQVLRFLLYTPPANDDHETTAFNALCRALAWKKSYGLHDRTDATFPLENWSLNSVEIAGRDRQGRPIQWETMHNQVVFKEVRWLTKQFVAHCFEKIDRLAGDAGFIAITDSTGAGMNNIDLEVTKFKIEVLGYYPGGIRQYVVVELPWLLNAIMKMIVGLMPKQLAELVTFKKASELSSSIDPVFIPERLGGQRKGWVENENLVTMELLTKKLNLSEEFVDKYFKTFGLPRIYRGKK